MTTCAECIEQFSASEVSWERFTDDFGSIIRGELCYKCKLEKVKKNQLLPWQEEFSEKEEVAFQNKDLIESFIALMKKYRRTSARAIEQFHDGMKTPDEFPTDVIVQDLVNDKSFSAEDYAVAVMDLKFAHDLFHSMMMAVHGIYMQKRNNEALDDLRKFLNNG